jgi:hypothetical protein
LTACLAISDGSDFATAFALIETIVGQPFALVNLLPPPPLTEAHMLTAVNPARLLRGATPSAACNPTALLPSSCWRPHRSIGARARFVLSPACCGSRRVICVPILPHPSQPELWPFYAPCLSRRAQKVGVQTRMIACNSLV